MADSDLELVVHGAYAAGYANGIAALVDRLCADSRRISADTLTEHVEALTAPLLAGVFPPLTAELVLALSLAES